MNQVIQLEAEAEHRKDDAVSKDSFPILAKNVAKWHEIMEKAQREAEKKSVHNGPNGETKSAMTFVVYCILFLDHNSKRR